MDAISVIEQSNSWEEGSLSAYKLFLSNENSMFINLELINVWATLYQFLFF